MTEPTPEEKKRITEVILELKYYVQHTGEILRLPMDDRRQCHARLAELKKELQQFREKYPHVQPH